MDLRVLNYTLSGLARLIFDIHISEDWFDVHFEYVDLDGNREWSFAVEWGVMFNFCSIFFA